MSAIKITATVYDYSKFDEIEIVEGINYKDVVRDFISSYNYTYEGKIHRLCRTFNERTLLAEVSA